MLQIPFYNFLSQKADIREKLRLYSVFAFHALPLSVYICVDTVLNCNYIQMREKRREREREKERTKARIRMERQRKSAMLIRSRGWANRDCETALPAIVNQLARIVNKSPFYNSTALRRTTSV